MKTMMVALLALWLFNSPAYAQQRCDCSVKEGECQAQLLLSQDLLEVTTDTEQCAEVLFYLDGYPHVTLVTDGREVQEYLQVLPSAQAIGHCGICKDMPVSQVQRLEAAQACSDDLLMPTEQTVSCEQACDAMPVGQERQQCTAGCQRHSLCLEKNCVESLRQKYQQCGRRCDREMQSSMEADIDVYTACSNKCKIIRDQINSCPVL